MTVLPSRIGFTELGNVSLDMEPIIPIVKPFDHPDWTLELKFDGFRGLADTVRVPMSMML